MRKPDIGKVVVVLMPNGFTLLNLCLGMLAIIYAFAGDFEQAGICVVVGGVCDALDGRVARATRTGSRFGEELDSLVDIVSFGVAPAMIMYSAVLKDQTFGWLWPFIFIAAAAIRLAKFNVEQAGRKKTHFFGLPSPAAGMTLATYFWFRETPLYMESWLSALPWQQTMQIVMVVLAVLMMSNVQYAAVPTIGFKSVRGLLGTLVVLVTLVGVAFFPRQFFFPALITYVAYGLLKTAVAGLLGLRLSFVNNGEAAVEEVLPGETAVAEESPAARSGPLRFRGGRRGRRRRRGGGRGGGGGGSGGSGGSGGPSGGTP